MIESIFEILGAGLRLWADKEARKYLDRLMELKRDYYLEYSKALDERSDAELDRITFELLLLGRAFSSSVGPTHVAPKPG